jgi:hypothetical protein
VVVVELVVVVVLSPLLEVGVKVLQSGLVRYRLPSDWGWGWHWLVIGVIGVIVLSFIWPLLGHFSAIFATVVLLPFTGILT